MFETFAFGYNFGIGLVLALIAIVGYIVLAILTVIATIGICAMLLRGWRALARKFGKATQ